MNATHLASVNGCDLYFKQWLGRSTSLHLENNSKISFRKPSDKTHFVFGGNSNIEGSHELRNASWLYNFKTSNPSNVTLIAGRNDIKHLILSSSNQHNLDDVISLNHFAMRRIELARLRQSSSMQIPNSDVVNSFIEEGREQGIMGKFLSTTVLALVIEDTLFTPGPITRTNMGFLPGTKNTGKRISCAKEWIEASNDWFITHTKNILSMGPNYQDSVRLINQSLFLNYDSMITARMDPNGIDPQVSEYLNNAGIYRVLIGNSSLRPRELPIIVENPHLTIVVGDTSNSDLKDLVQSRGALIHNLDITYENGHSTLRIDAISKKEKKVSIVIPPHKELQLTSGAKYPVLEPK